jgi:hypothetical protein
MAASAGSIEHISSMATSVSSTTATTTMTWPIAPKAGQLLFMSQTNNASAAMTTVPSGWTQILGGSYSSGARGVTSAYRFADGTEGSSVTWTVTGSTQNLGVMTAFSGVSNAVVPATYTQGSGSGSATVTPNPGGSNYTLMSAPGMFISGIASNGTYGTPTVSSGSFTSVEIAKTINYSTVMCLALCIGWASTVPNATAFSLTYGANRTWGASGQHFMSSNSALTLSGIGA